MCIAPNKSGRQYFYSFISRLPHNWFPTCMYMRYYRNEKKRNESQWKKNFEKDAKQCREIYEHRTWPLCFNEPFDVSPFLSILSLRRRIALVVIAWLDRQDRILNREEFISRGSHPLIVPFETRKGAITSARVLRERIYADILRRLIIFCFRAYHMIPIYI